MDFTMLPPEINSGLLYAGPGPQSLLTAATAWSGVAEELQATASGIQSVLSGLESVWQGPSSQAMTSSVVRYVQSLEVNAAHAEQTSASAAAAASAFGAAFAAVVPPPVIAANRAQLLMLVATNVLGQNTPAIMANEALYAQMWAQDAAAMNAYAASSQAVTSGLPQFTQPTQVANPGSAAAIGTGGWLDNSTTTGQLIQALISSGFPIDVAQLFANFIGYTEMAAAMEDVGNRETAAMLANPGPVTVVPAGAPPVEAPVSAPVTAASGVGGQIGRLSVPPSWAQPQTTPQTTPEEPKPIRAQIRGQTAIPAVPFMPVTSAGRSNQGKVRSEPEYGHVSKVLPPRNPAAG